MWFFLFKIFRLGYSEAKKHKAKKQQQQQQPQYQQPYPAANPYFAGEDTNNYNYDYNNNYNMDFPTQTPPPQNKQNKRTKIKILATQILNILQFAFGLAVVGLYGRDVNAARDAGNHAPAKWVYAVTTGVLASGTAMVYLFLGWWWKKKSGLRDGFGAPAAVARRRRLHLPLFVWEGVLVVLWLVVFGIFGEMYIGVYYVGGEDGEGDKVTRMRRAVWVDLVNLVFWVLSGTWKGVRWWKAKGAATAAARDGSGGEVEGEKEMV